MNEIIKTEYLGPDVKLLELVSPRIARKRKAGQFVIVRVADNGERIPLTIANSDMEKGTITIIVQGIGRTTKRLNKLEVGDTIHDVVGPLGMPSELEVFGHSVVIGGGVGTAIAFPTAKALKEAGNKVSVIIGGRSKDFIILEDEISEFADKVYPTTDDGSYGFHGFVTQKLEEMIKSGEKIDHVLAIGPIPMMEAVAKVTKEFDIPTVASLNPLMIDGTGMCGVCRVEVGGKTKFACVDGPEFDAHKVNFDILTKRNRNYDREEKIALEKCGGVK